MSKFKTGALAVILLLVGSTARAAVYEVDADGTVNLLDAPPARVVQSRPRTSPVAAARAASWRPTVVDAANRFQISPALVDAIAHIESRYDQAAVSPAGAAGIMQLMPGTARQLGVDRHDPAANIRGGTAYIRYLLNRFDGDLVCTIAAYNAGPAAVTKRKCLPPYKETVAYVRQVLDRLAADTNESETADQ